MHLFNPRSWFTKASAVGSMLSERVLGQAVWSKRDYQSFAKEAYTLNAIANKCIRLIAGGAAEVPLKLLGPDGSEIENHPLLELLRRPSATASGRTFFEAVYAYLMIAGNSYIEAVANSKGVPQELWVHRPDRIQILPGDGGIPRGYKFTVGGKSHIWTVDQLNGDSPIMHLSEFNPTDDWYGLSRIEAAGYGIDRHNAASAHNKALIDNGARPSGALVFEPITNGGRTQAVPQETIEATKEQMRKTYSGPDNAGKPMVFGGNVKWEQMGMTPLDMDYLNGKEDAARDICLAFGVPPILVVNGETAMNNRSEAKLELYETNILPLVSFGVGELNSWLVPKFGEGLRLVPDLDGVLALEPRRERKRKSTVELLSAGVIDHHEARENLGYGAREPETVARVDPALLTALVTALPHTGIVPLARYMRSVQLVPDGTSDDDILNAATDFIDAVDIPAAPNDGVPDAKPKK